MSAPYNNPTEGQIIADIVAAADYVFGVALNPANVQITGRFLSIKNGNSKSRRSISITPTHIDVDFLKFFRISTPDGWRECIGVLLYAADYITEILPGRTIAKVHSLANAYNFPREVEIRGGKRVVYRMRDINRGATIREIGAQAFDHVLPKSLAAAAEPFRADWVAAHAILAQPAPKTFDELRAAMTTVAPVYPNLHGVIGPMPAKLARKIEDWYLAEITRAVDRAGILMAEREAARATIERINREFTAAADAQKWIVNGEEVSGADIELN